MSWDVTIKDVVVHDCPNCGGHDEGNLLDQNITYNVGRMLRRAGIHPQIINGMNVKDAYQVVSSAVAVMEDNPDYFKRFNAVNGWGTYDTTLEAVVNIANALHEAIDESHTTAELRWV